MKTLSSKKLSLLFFFIIIIFLICFTETTLASRPRQRRSTTKTTEFIRKSCRATTYPRLCVASLSVHASKIQTSPSLLAATALNVSLSSAESTTNSILRLSDTKMKPRDASAMRDCIEELGDSVEELRMSIDEMTKIAKGDNDRDDRYYGKFRLVMSDVQTWVSAALTDENTCADGFQGKLKVVVRGKIVNVARLTSNALALINRYALIHG